MTVDLTDVVARALAANFIGEPVAGDVVAAVTDALTVDDAGDYCRCHDDDPTMEALLEALVAYRHPKAAAALTEEPTEQTPEGHARIGGEVVPLSMAWLNDDGQWITVVNAGDKRGTLGTRWFYDDVDEDAWNEREAADD